MELRHLRYFVAVAEHGSFSKAAAALETAQPSLSQQIRQLEREIGTELFTRERRKIALTAAGAAFLAETRALFAQLDTAVTHAREAGRGLRGELRIGYTPSAMMSTLPVAIRAYRLDHPDVRLTLLPMTIDALTAALRGHEIDNAVFPVQPDLRRFADIDVRRIGTLELGAVVPDGHPLARRASFAIEEIGAETLILYGRDAGDIYDVVLKLCRERDFTPARIEEINRVETILGLVAAGEGVSIVPEVYASLGFRGVAYRELDPAPEPFALIVAGAHDAHSPLGAAFMDTAAGLAAAPA
jgi:DNA-binding transcriptional LysR family regulator